MRIVEKKAIEYARKRGYDIICCGHTHHAVINESGPVWYYNSGCWTERPCHYLTIENGTVQQHIYEEVAENSMLEPRMLMSQTPKIASNGELLLPVLPDASES